MHLLKKGLIRGVIPFSFLIIISLLWINFKGHGQFQTHSSFMV